MNQRHLTRILLGLSLLEEGRVYCQTRGATSTGPPSPPGASAISPYEPDTKECKDQIMTHEELWELQIRSGSHHTEITIQKLKKGGQNLSIPDAVNFYEGETTFGRKTKFHKIFERVNWRFFWSGFDLRGFAQMCFVDPNHFDSLNYDLQYSGEKSLLGRRCWIYRMTSKIHSEGWQFEGTIWVLRDDLTITRTEGAFHPMHKIQWPLLVEDHWFSYDSWRKETSAGKWVSDFTCTGVDVASSDFTNPAIRARITFIEEGDKPSANSANACGMELGQFPTREVDPNHKLGAAPE